MLIVKEVDHGKRGSTKQAGQNLARQQRQYAAQKEENYPKKGGIILRLTAATKSVASVQISANNKP